MKSKILHMLLALAIAFALWVYVITVVSPESEDTFYNVPVVLNNESVLNDNGLMVVSNGEPKIALKLKGNRSDLNNLKSSDITVIADLSRIDGPGEKQLNYSVSYPGSMSFEILNQEPQEITLTIAEWATKEVDVNVVYQGSTPPEYIADTDGVELDYQKITVTGPKEVVDEITQAVIDVNLENVTQTITQSYAVTLCDEEGQPVDAATVEVNAPEVQMTLRILQVKEVQLKLDVSYGGGATEQTSNVSVDPLTIKVAGSEKLLEGLDSLTLGAVNLAELMEDSTLTFPINLPEGVENLSGVNEATVDVKFPNLKVKTLSVSAILMRNVPTGMNVQMTTKVLEVKVRGTEAQINAITDKDLTVRVDFTDAELGEGKFKAEILVNTEFNTVGVVGTYYVYATLTATGGG